MNFQNMTQTEFYKLKRENGHVPRKQTNKVITGEIVRRYPPKQKYWTMGQVEIMIAEKATIIRFWLKTFGEIENRAKNRNDNRAYRFFTWDDIERLKKIKHLLRVEKYTIEGAKLKL